MGSWRKILCFSLAAVVLALIPTESLLYGDIPANRSANSALTQLDTLTPLTASIFDFDKWYPRLNLEQKTNDDRSLGRVGLMYPLWQNKNEMIFSDIRTVFDDRDSFEMNFGGGYRRIIRDSSDDSKGWIWGLYGFFDRRKSPHDNYFNQATLGTEILSNNFEVRGNFYLPSRDSYVVGRRNSLSGRRLSGTVIVDNFDLLEAREYALPGFDVEAGYGFDIGEKDKLWLYGGYFSFDRSQTPKVAGPRGRIQYEINDAFGMAGTVLALGLEVRKDDIRGTDTVFTIGLSIPLGAPPVRAKSYYRSIDSRMMRPVVRDVDVKSFSEDINKAVGSEGGPRKTGTEQVPVRDASGNVINLYFVDGGPGGNGTQASPMTAAQADAAAGESDVIFLLNDAGTVDTDTTLHIERNGRLLGIWSGNTKNVSVGGITIVVTSSDGVPTLNNTDATQDVVAVDSGVRVEGLYITGGKIGIVGTGTAAAPVQGLNVKNVRINDVAGAGMSFDYLSGTADFQNVWLANSGTIGAQAIYLNHTPAAAAVTFDNISIGAAGGTSVANAGIKLTNTAGTVSFARTTVENAGNTSDHAVWVNTVSGTGSITFASPTIGHSGTASAFRIGNVGSSAKVSCTGNTTISESHGGGIEIGKVAGTVEFGDVTIGTSPQIGIRLVDNDGTISFGSSTVGIAYMGIYVVDNAGTISFGSSTVGSAADKGIYVAGNDGAISFGDSCIVNAGLGIYAEHNGGTISFGSSCIDAASAGIIVASNDGTISFGESCIDAADTGISVASNDGTISFGESYVDAADTGINVAGNDGTISFGSSYVHHADTGISVAGNDGTISFGESKVSFAADTGIKVAGNDGAVSFGQTDVYDADMGIFALNNGGTISFGTTFVDKSVREAIDLFNNWAAISFGDTTVTNWDTGGAGFYGIHLSGNTGPISFGTTKVGGTTVPSSTIFGNYYFKPPNMVKATNNTSVITFGPYPP